MENLNTGQAVLKSLNALGFRGVVQGMLKYRDPQSNWSAHYLDFRNRKSVFLLLSNLHQFLSLCTERKRFYMAILLSFEVALSVPASIWIQLILRLLDKASVTHAVHSLFYSYSLEWRQHFEKHTILAYLYHVSNTMTTNDYKWAKIFICLSRFHRVTPCCLWPILRFHGNSVGARSKTLQDPRKTKL